MSINVVCIVVLLFHLFQSHCAILPETQVKTVTVKVLWKKRYIFKGLNFGLNKYIKAFTNSELFFPTKFMSEISQIIFLDRKESCFGILCNILPIRIPQTLVLFPKAW